MRTQKRDIFTTVRTEGNLLPMDLLQRVAEGDRNLEGLTPETYHIGKNERLNEVINRAWKRCQTAWAAFQKEAQTLPDADAGTTLTRERWLLVLFQELGYGRLLTARAKEIDGKTYPIRHFWNNTPIHLVSFRHNLDRRTPGVAGAARLRPHGLIQEFLNRSQDHLWGMVSNGLSLRLLRDNASLTRQAYVEFDLDGMMSGEVYSDFILLFLLLHQSRVEAEKPEQFWLEQWTRKAQEQGTRALDQLRSGVEQAIVSLGKGFLAHAGNAQLREKLRNGDLDAHDLYQQLLRLIYRLIFLFVAEDRKLLLLSEASEEAKRRYLNHYSLNRIRRMAGRVRGTRHADLWEGLRITFRCLYQGEPALGTDPLGGFLFSPDAIPDLNDCGLSNESLLEAVRHLSYTREGRTLRPVDYRNLGTEELGSVYESLLELHPEVNTAAAAFDLRVAAGSDRKTTGSYYTPTSLINCLLDSALEPVIEERLKEARELANREIASRKMASGEVANRRKNGERRDYNGRYIISGSESLAREHGTGRGLLQGNTSISQGRDLRHDVADQTRFSVDTGEHSGGMGKVGDEGVHSISSSGAGKPQGTGNTRYPLAEGGASERGSIDPTPREMRETGQDDSFPDWFFEAQRIWERQSGRLAGGNTENRSNERYLPIPYSLLAEQGLLALRIVDPASGSGHFLIAAAHRMAKHLAMIRTGEAEPAPEERRKAIRDVVSHCIYGVDLNPLAVELCKVALWIETLDPGKPLGFLDHHIKCGNSLIGATPELLEKGIPDDAFKPVEGDDPKAATAIRKKNREERRSKQKTLFAEQAAPPGLEEAIEEIREWGFMPEDNQQAVSDKAALYQTLVDDPGIRHAKEVADLWTAAFFWPLTDASAATVPTEDRFRRFQEGSLDLPEPMRKRMRSLARKHRFFHWHLEFPEVFGDDGGFDCVLGNPPWERVNIEARQFFALANPEIAGAITAKRREMIDQLEVLEPDLFAQFMEVQRQASTGIKFAQCSGTYSRLNQARINTYVLFVETATKVVNPKGRIGIIVPSGIATDETCKKIFSFLIRESRIESLFDFENRQGLFPGIHREYKFSLLTIRGSRADNSADFAFFLQTTDDLRARDKLYKLSIKDFHLLSPISGLCPTFRSRRDREIVLGIYKDVRPLILQQEQKYDWSKSDFLIMFRSDNSSHLYKSSDEIGLSHTTASILPQIVIDDLIYLPVWESKLLHQFDHRFSTFADTTPEARGKGNAIELSDHQKHEAWIAIPRYWTLAEAVENSLKTRSWSRLWLVGYRDITNATNERTAIAAILPIGGAAQPLNLFLPESSVHACLWVGAMNSFVVDYVTRQRIGGVHLNITTCRQLPIMGPKSMSNEHAQFIIDRVLELTYTSPALEPFAGDCRFFGPPFLWEEDRRFRIRCELDAAFFHIYGINRDDADYIMENFPIVKRKDEQKYGEYRTKRVILDCYDAMAEAMKTGRPYQTILNPPPVHLSLTIENHVDTNGD